MIQGGLDEFSFVDCFETEANPKHALISIPQIPMCGRYTLIADPQKLAEEFELVETDFLQPRFNIAPTQSAPVVRVLAEEGRRRLDQLRWGLVPHWTKDPSIGNRMINARSEEAASKPAFRNALRKQRCLIPSTGFYEWMKEENVADGTLIKKPYLIRRRDERVFAFAGLWECWHGPDKDRLESYTILTTSPNEMMQSVHNRMPVIIDRKNYELWLDPTVQDAQRLAPLFQPFPSAELSAFAVSTRVNSPRNDDPSCVKPL